MIFENNVHIQSLFPSEVENKLEMKSEKRKRNDKKWSIYNHNQITNKLYVYYS